MYNDAEKAAVKNVDRLQGVVASQTAGPPAPHKEWLHTMLMERRNRLEAKYTVVAHAVQLVRALGEADAPPDVFLQIQAALQASGVLY